MPKEKLILFTKKRTRLTVDKYKKMRALRLPRQSFIPYIYLGLVCSSEAEFSLAAEGATLGKLPQKMTSFSFTGESGCK